MTEEPGDGAGRESAADSVADALVPSVPDTVERPVLHSDGVVCRCAVRWRQLALTRGLNNRLDAP